MVVIKSRSNFSWFSQFLNSHRCCNNEPPLTCLYSSQKLWLFVVRLPGTIPHHSRRKLGGCGNTDFLLTGTFLKPRVNCNCLSYHLCKLPKDNLMTTCIRSSEEGEMESIFLHLLPRPLSEILLGCALCWHVLALPFPDATLWVRKML